MKHNIFYSLLASLRIIRITVCFTSVQVFRTVGVGKLGIVKVGTDYIKMHSAVVGRYLPSKWVYTVEC